MNVINLKKAFTLTEVIISIVIVSIIAMFAIPSYTKANKKTHERDILMQLSSIHAANEIYRAQSQNRSYADFSGDETNINTNLSLNILPNGVIYNYTYVAVGTSGSYTVTATWDTIEITLIETAFDPLHTNPCCSSGVCLIAVACSG